MNAIYLFNILIVTYITISCSTSDKIESCQCYMLGTVESIEGRSICNKNNFKCKCHKNVIGTNCEKCQPGFYGILSGRGCLNRCNCDPIGSLHNNCNQITGQCMCKPGFIGYRCETCPSSFYLSKENDCVKCFCHVLGTTDQQCDQNGKCKCLSEVYGSKCDRCSFNRYDLAKGCIECPKCYSLLEQNLKILEERIEKANKQLNVIMEKIDKNEIKARWKVYLQQMENLNKSILKLKTDVENIKYIDTQKLKNVLDKLNKLQKKYESVEKNLKLIAKTYSELDLENIMKKKDEISIKSAKTALTKAKKKSENIDKDSKNLKDIKHAAVEVAQTLVSQVVLLKSTSETANEKCANTCAKSNNLQQLQIKLQNELDEIMKHGSKINTKNLQSTADKSLSTTEYNLGFAIKMKNEIENMKTLNVGNNVQINVDDMKEMIRKLSAKNLKTKKTTFKIKNRNEYIVSTINKESVYKDKITVINDKIKLLMNNIENIILDKQNIVKEYYKNKKDAKKEAEKLLAEFNPNHLEKLLQEIRELDKAFQSQEDFINKTKNAKELLDSFIFNDINIEYEELVTNFEIYKKNVRGKEKDSKDLDKIIQIAKEKLKKLTEFKKSIIALETKIKELLGKKEDLEQLIIILKTILPGNERVVEINNALNEVQNILEQKRQQIKEYNELKKEVTFIGELVDDIKKLGDVPFCTREVEPKND